MTVKWEYVYFPEPTVKDGVAYVAEDAPLVHAVKAVWRDEEGRRCTRFLGRVHGTAAGYDLVAALERCLIEQEVA